MRRGFSAAEMRGKGGRLRPGLRTVDPLDRVSIRCACPSGQQDPYESLEVGSATPSNSGPAPPCICHPSGRSGRRVVPNRRYVCHAFIEPIPHIEPEGLELSPDIVRPRSLQEDDAGLGRFYVEAGRSHCRLEVRPVVDGP